jgi:hypothetical protein
VEEGIHEHIGGEAKLPALMKTLWCSFRQLRSMCFSPIPSYFTEYVGDLVLLGSVMRPSIDSDTSHQPTYLIATRLTLSNGKVTRFQLLSGNYCVYLGLRPRCSHSNSLIAGPYPTQNTP